MKGTRSVIIAMVLFIVFSNVCFSNGNDVFGDIFISYEDLLRQSDCIIVATVENTYTEREKLNNDDLLQRYTTVRVENLIKGKHIKPGDSIVLKTTQGEYKDDLIQELFYNPASFTKGDEVLLYLRIIDNEYRLFYETYGKFDIIDGMIEHSGTSKAEFIAEIKNVLEEHKSKFELQYPDYYINEKTTFKKTNQTEDYVSLPCADFQFRPGHWYSDMELPVNITFYINPDGGYALPDSTYIGFNTLKDIAENACDMWNAVNGGAICFSVASDSVTYGVADDEYSVICFDAQSGTASAHVEYKEYDNNVHEWDVEMGTAAWS